MFLLSPHVRMIESAVTCFRVLEHSALDCIARTVLKRKWNLGGTSSRIVKIMRRV